MPRASPSPTGYLVCRWAHFLRVGLERGGDLEHVQEGIDAFERLADVDGASEHVDAHRQGALGGVPDDFTALLGGHHRQRARGDEVVLAQVSGADGATGLFVADQVDDDAAVAEQAQILAAAAP